MLCVHACQIRYIFPRRSVSSRIKTKWTKVFFLNKILYFYAVTICTVYQYSKYVHSMRELVCIYTRVQYVSRYMYAGVGGGVWEWREVIRYITLTLNTDLGINLSNTFAKKKDWHVFKICRQQTTGVMK